ncbi:polysaccharide biosynthesis/export family protein [Sulfurimonas marina]|uniref:Polysaccharide export protein n=1 Tax=Sulfurimonas marina TaxID=2590551 RepID=A0A7M1AYH1_9BACT|nr:polysaccharide biosynthesis/export family protein [Sulfurimonas marina]QOP41442.1 polysaccharide export protein [Sulfurimonas marina]
MKKILVTILILLTSLAAVELDVAPKETESNVSMMQESKKVFGNRLFNGSFSQNKQHRYNPNYLINIGDVVNIRLWGAFDFNASIPVDSQGNIFLPKVGTIKLVGLKNEELSRTLQSKIKSVFKTNVYVYADLGNYQPVSVFVTGAVNKPGLYEGLSSDSIIQFLDKARGIENEFGSYRNITVLRDNKTVKSVDLYNFLLNGKLDLFQFQTGDVVNVESVKNYVEINGDVKRPYRFEMKGASIELSELLKAALPNPTATNFTVTKWNQENEQSVSIHSIKGNEHFTVHSGEVVEFLPDHNAKSIAVKISGEHLSLHNIVVPKGSTLGEVFEKIKPSILSDMDSFQLYRKSIAEEQKKLLDAQLNDLEAKTLTTGSMSSEEATIRAQESQLVMNFIERAKQVELKGKVVINKDTNLSLITLEDGDEIYIPKKSHMVIVQGEVMLPGAQSYVDGMSFEEYINSCGGYSFRANTDNVLIIKKNGQVVSYDPSSSFGESYSVKPGDAILVMGKVDTKYLQVIKDITQIVYQIAVGAAVVLRY